MLIERRQRGSSGQIEIYPSDIASVSIAKPTLIFQEEIGRLFIRAYQLRKISKALYAEAEALLLHELGLDSLDLSHELSYEASFSAMSAVNRMDAEYFQPKFDRIIDLINRTEQAVRLGDWVAPIRRGTQPTYSEDREITVINSQHVGKTHIELDDNRYTTQDFVIGKSFAVVRPYDVLLNSTGYITIGRCQVMLDDVPAMVDGHVSIIRPKSGLDPVYLAMFLNTLPGQMQTERNWTGSSGQIELRVEAINNYTIWRPSQDLQLKIRQMVEEAHRARQEASHLLDEAKQRVEALILGSVTG